MARVLLPSSINSFCIAGISIIVFTNLRLSGKI
jgi:hypothetical protein